MKTKKKLLAMFLALCMIGTVFAALPTTAFAASENGFTYSISGGKATITGYTGSGGDVVIPSTLGSYPVTCIGDHVFNECTRLTNVTIPNSVTSIGMYAFSGTSLTSVTIPESVTSFGICPFYRCNSLTSIEVDKDNPNYYSEDGVLFSKNNTALIQYPKGNTRTSYTIPDNITSIERSAFDYCLSLTNVTIGNSVTTIGEEAFNVCTNLKSVTIGNSVKIIEYRAFGYCSGLTNIAIPNSVTNIEDEAFIGCSGLVSVTIPDSVTGIGKGAFYNCTGLTSVTIGNGVTGIGHEAFRNCESLASVTIGSGVTTIEYSAFSGCQKLETIHWNAVNVTNYVKDVFYYAGAEGSGIRVIFGDLVQSIPEYCFYSDFSSRSPKITSVTIPNSVASIGNGAFYNCTSLTDVYYSGTEEDWNEIIIGSNNDAILQAEKHFDECSISLDKIQSVQTNKGENATMRFFFTPEYNKGEAENYGAYIIPMWVFDQGGAEDAALIKKNESIESGVQYSADLKLIPKDCFDDTILALPFITIGGKAKIIIDPDAYNGNTVNNTDIHQQMEN